MVYKEKEFRYKRYKCVILFTSLGHRCGYVGIPKKHFLYNKNYYERRMMMEFKIGDIIDFGRGKNLEIIEKDDENYTVREENIIERKIKKLFLEDEKDGAILMKRPRTKVTVWLTDGFGGWFIEKEFEEEIASVTLSNGSYVVTLEKEDYFGKLVYLYDARCYKITLEPVER